MLKEKFIRRRVFQRADADGDEQFRPNPASQFLKAWGGFSWIQRAKTARAAWLSAGSGRRSSRRQTAELLDPAEMRLAEAKPVGNPLDLVALILESQHTMLHIDGR